MVFRQCIKCKTCNSITLLRIQVGYLEEMPLSIGCARCGVILRGIAIQDPANTRLNLNFENADLVKEPRSQDILQEIECSSEFPVRRFVNHSKAKPKITPFIFSISNMGIDRYLEFAAHYHCFADLWKAHRSDLQTITELYLAEKYDLLVKVIKEQFFLTPNGNDVMSIISIFYEVYSRFCLHLFPPEHFEVQTRSVLNFVGETYKKHEKKFKPFLEFLYKQIHLPQETQKGFILLNTFMQDYAYFLPIICITYFKPGRISRPYGGIFFITTVDYEEIKQFYVDIFEWTCRMLTFLMGIANIGERGDFNKMPTVLKRSFKKINNLHKYHYSPNGIKKDFTDTSNFLRDYFGDALDNQIRNAIGHYKTRYDAVEQIIKYYPFNDPIRSHISKRIYLIDFVEYIYRHILKVYDILYAIGILRMLAGK